MTLQSRRLIIAATITDARILNQRSRWCRLLPIPAWLGGGAVSLDALIRSRSARGRIGGFKPGSMA
jgi:hypothetical protein